MSFGLEADVVDPAVYDKNLQLLRSSGVKLPKISELADPVRFLGRQAGAEAWIDPDAPDPGNLFRVHWHNSADRREQATVPEHLVLDPALTGVDATIVVALGNRFPMIRAHKVLAAYGCLVPRLLSGKFDASHHRAIWPSTGNYCRGGIAISRILGCRGVAVLPEGMSTERFRWLENWVTDTNDIVRTPGTESNVKEIFDACHDLSRDPRNIIFNQFSELGNYIIHRAVTGPALERIFNHLNMCGNLRPRAFVAASGSSGTLAAGDHLKHALGTEIGVVEALECPTLLYNGYGEHNIQGIGDKHVPLIHNVMNTDFVIGVSDTASDNLNLLFNTTAGRSFLTQRTGLGQEEMASLNDLGLSSIANVLGAIKYAKYKGLTSSDVVLTVATDGAEMYETELSHAADRMPAGHFDSLAAAETYGRWLLGLDADHVLELDHRSRNRVFNLGYYTWVEQQGISLTDFDIRRDQSFWDGLMNLVEVWDAMIARFNTA